MPLDDVRRDVNAGEKATAVAARRKALNSMHLSEPRSKPEPDLQELRKRTPEQEAANAEAAAAIAEAAAKAEAASEEERAPASYGSKVLVRAWNCISKDEAAWKELEGKFGWNAVFLRSSPHSNHQTLEPRFAPLCERDGGRKRALLDPVGDSRGGEQSRRHVVHRGVGRTKARVDCCSAACTGVGVQARCQLGL